MYKVILFLIGFAMLLSSCTTQNINSPNARVLDVKGIITYEFSRIGEFYCQTDCSILIDRKSYPFYDVRDYNARILHENADLQVLVGSDTSFGHFFWIPDSTINLSFSLFKLVNNSIDGKLSISSQSVFKKPEESNKLFIVFAMSGRVIHYYGIKRSNENNLFTNGICPRYNVKRSSEFLVLVKSNCTSKISEKEQHKLKLIPSDIQTIKLLNYE